MTKVALQISGEKTDASINGYQCQAQLVIHIEKKVTLDSNLISYIKINSRWIKDRVLYSHAIK